jgi:hypothetical protein
MPTELDRQLTEVRQERRRRDKLRDTLSRAQEELSHSINQKEALRETLVRAGTDVQQLEAMSFTHLMVSLFGDQEVELDKSEKELAMAQLSYDEVMGDVQVLREEVEKIESQLQSIPPDLDSRYQDLMTQKEKLLLLESSETAHFLLELAELLADTGSEALEIGEALLAGEHTLSALNALRDQLEAASNNWGAIDMLGSGRLTTMIKHGKLDKAKDAANKARQHLDRFSRELRNVRLRADGLEVDVDSFTRFADSFLDGLLFDWIVQSEIGRAEDDVDKSTSKVRGVMASLRTREQELALTLDELERQRAEIIDRA